MKRRHIAFMLVLLMLVQVFAPEVVWAKSSEPSKQTTVQLVKMGALDPKTYPKLDNKAILAIQKQARNNQNRSRTGSSGFFSAGSPYLPGQNPSDDEKAAAYGNLRVNFATEGLKDNGVMKPFQWNEIFGTDSNGNPGTANIYFVQRDAKTNKKINTFKLTVDKAGKYSLNDLYGKPAKLPLYSQALEPYKYEVELETGVSEKITLLTKELSPTGSESSSFKTDNDGNIVADIPLYLKIGQAASTKFVSKWNTDVEEAKRPKVVGGFNNKTAEDFNYFPFPSNDTYVLKIRREKFDLENDDWPGYMPQTPSQLGEVPNVTVEEDMLEDPSTYTIDKVNSRIAANGKTYKYDLQYDVINGGKLTMTEIIPVTFDANGGKFASITNENAEQKVVKDVLYGKDMTEQVEMPSKYRAIFKGWGLKNGGTLTPIKDVDFKEIKTAKTFYAIWEDKKIPEVKTTPEKVVPVGGPVEAKELVTNRYNDDDPDNGDNLPPGSKITFKEPPNLTDVGEKTAIVVVELPDGEKVEKEVKIIVVEDVVKQEGKDKPKVPDNYVSLTIDTTDKATDLSTYKDLYWVNPAKAVEVEAKQPKGKLFGLPEGKQIAWKFKEWVAEDDKDLSFEYNKEKTGDPFQYTLIKGMVTKDVYVKATYNFATPILIPALTIQPYVVPVGTEVYPKDLIKNTFENDAQNKALNIPTMPKGTSYRYEVDNHIPDQPITKDVPTVIDVKVRAKYNQELYPGSQGEPGYSGDREQVVAAKITFVDHLVPQVGDQKPLVPDNYVRVAVNPTDLAVDKTVHYYWVNPKQAVNIPAANPTATGKNRFLKWTMKADSGSGNATDFVPSTAYTFTEDTTITAQYKMDDIIPYDPAEPITRPDGYVRVTFTADEGVSLANIKAYYVRKNAGVRLGNPELAKPQTAAKIGYRFDKWDKEDNLEITDSDVVVKALATPLPDTIEKQNGTDKPAGYVEVNFVAGQNGTVEEKTYYVNPGKYVTITPPAARGNTGYEFGSWDKDASIPTVYEQNTTITANFNQLKAVVPKTKKDDSEKPAGYKTVTFFIDGDGGSIVDGQTSVYFVDPNREVILQAPQTNAETGYKFKQWDADTALPHKYEQDTRIKGSFEKQEDIVPATDTAGKPNPKPDGYVTVNFDKGSNGTLKGQTVYYVNPNAGKTLRDIHHPSIQPEVGYQAAGWDKDDTAAIKADLTVIAKYAGYNDVIPKTKNDDSEKPDGYITVTFKTTDKGGNVTKVVFINPNKAVALQGQAPTVSPITGYEFSDWDRPVREKVQYADGDVITAKFNEIGNVSKVEKPGYVKVKFKQGAHGSLDGTVDYWIKPDADVTLTAPKVQAGIGYKFQQWDKPLAIRAQAGDPTYVITAQYEALEDIIPKTKTDDSEKPAGYVTVTFITDGHGSLDGTTTYYVNPNKTVDFSNTAEGLIKKPYVGYTATGGTWTPAELKNTFKNNASFKFNFVQLDDVIPAVDGKDKPEGYVTVKLIPTAKATDATKMEKSYWVKADTEVTLTNQPVGKEEKDANGITYKHGFTGWTVTRGTIASWTGADIVGKFIQDTEITAKYTTSVDPGEILAAPQPKKDAVTPIKDVPKPEDLITNGPGTGTNPLPEGTTFTYTDDGTPDVSKPGNQTAKVKVKYPNGKVTIIEVPVTVVDNIVPQPGKDKPLVPGTYIQVTVDTTDKATANSYFVKTFWVKPNEEVTIPDILAPTGKPETVGGVTQTNQFVRWQRQDSPDKVYEKEIKDAFAAATTIIAIYEQDKNVTPQGKDNPWVPQGSTPSPKDFIQNPYDDNDPTNKDNLPPGTKLEFRPGTEPNTGEPGENKSTTIKVIYPNGEVKEVPVTYRVTGDVVEQTDPNQKPNVPDNFVEVIVKTTDKATVDVTRTFWVAPTKEVTIPVDAPTGKVITDAQGNPVKDPSGTLLSWTFTGWSQALTGMFTEKQTVITAQYDQQASELAITAGMISTYVGKSPTVADYKEVIQMKLGSKKLSFENDVAEVKVTKEPDVSKVGMTEAQVEISFKNGTVQTVAVPVKVLKKEYKPGGSGGGVLPSDKPKPDKDALNKADHYQYLIGYPDGTFAPNRGMTRAEVATMFTRLLKERPVKWLHYSAGLSDIYAGDWYADTVGYAVEKGIVSGYPDGTFKPNQPITRAEFASIASRFAQLTDEQDISFIDLDASHWGYKAIRLAASNGWISGYPDNTFRPEQAITRAEVTSITNRMLNRHADLDWIDAHRAQVIRFSDVGRSDWFFEPVMEATMGHDFTRDADGKTEHWTGLNGKTFI